MQKGYLKVSVYLDTVATPIENANVLVEGENYSGNFKTNVHGKTGLIALDAPDKKYSEYPQYEIKPYAQYNLTITKSGFNTVKINKVEIFAEETALQDVYMKKEPGATDIIDMPEHELWESHGEYMPENDLYNDYAPKEELIRILPRTVIPEYIRVKNGVPTSNAAVLTVPFIDYIKNVTSSEIFSTWHPEAIKANVHAIVSFTLNRIYTEWYPSRGFNFTITASPAHDQMFINGRAIYQSISNVVDQYFNQYIRLTGRNSPFFAQYNDGINTNIPGRLSQWGSQNRALTGQSAIQILRHFYTPNLALHTAAQVVGLPNSFPGFDLRLGSCGQFVQDLQNRLNRIRTHFPGIPVITPTNGWYNESTRRSVETFQRVFNIPVTGVVNWATWFRISNIFTAVAGLQEGAR